jgi:uncharacterized damage-inducible protein DinB
MAEYNHWMNKKIFDACESLTPENITEDRGAFFGSILGTLNHLVIGDTLWLQRFSGTFLSYRELDPVAALPQPTALNAIVCTQLSELKIQRDLLDHIFVSFAEAVNEDDLLSPVTYTNIKGETFTRLFFSLLLHVFNHQTHHRGQVTTLLSQFGADIGVTDLVAVMPAG